MKIRIEVKDGLAEDEIVIRCAKADERAHRLRQMIADGVAGARQIVFYRQGRDFYFPPDNVLFFETEGDLVYAHTADDSFRVRRRLYELEETLPEQFIRVSKSAILNANRIHSITRNLAAASLVEFRDTHKRVYVSRRYYPALWQKLMQRSDLS